MTLENVKLYKYWSSQGSLSEVNEVTMTQILTVTKEFDLILQEVRSEKIFNFQR